MDRRIIGIDVGGTNFRIGAVNQDGEIKAFHKIPVLEVFHSEDVIDDLLSFLKPYMEELEAARIEPIAISIGFPATLDKNRTTVLQAPNVKFMENVPIRRALEAEFDIPVVIERDVIMALAYDEAKYGLQSSEILVGIYFGTGIGNAIKINGKALIGRNGTAGELGHIPVDGSDIPCGCGNRGCAENLAGGKYLTHLCETVYKDTYVGDIFTKHGNDELLLQFIDRMAQNIATEINILDPEYVLIGGGVLVMKDFPKQLLKERIYVHTRKPYPAKALDDIIIFTADEHNKCVIGAAFFCSSILEVFLYN